MEPYLGQIEAFAFNFAPRGWAMCQGQLLPIAQNQALFAVLGTTYGGDGVRTFALPDLRSRLAIGAGQGIGLSPRALGQVAGQEQHTLVVAEMPGNHTHAVNAVNNGTAGGTNVPGPTVLPASGYAAEAGNPPENVYGPPGGAGMGGLGQTGGQPHENRMPFLGLNYCIALSGVFPSQN
jgi:microcystin-dependent protein